MLPRCTAEERPASSCSSRPEVLASSCLALGLGLGLGLRVRSRVRGREVLASSCRVRGGGGKGGTGAARRVRREAAEGLQAVRRSCGVHGAAARHLARLEEDGAVELGDRELQRLERRRDLGHQGWGWGWGWGEG